jgi:hypothetical protein
MQVKKEIIELIWNMGKLVCGVLMLIGAVIGVVMIIMEVL